MFYVAPIDVPHCRTHACHTLESMTTGAKFLFKACLRCPKSKSCLQGRFSALISTNVYQLLHLFCLDISISQSSHGSCGFFHRDTHQNHQNCKLKTFAPTCSSCRLLPELSLERKMLGTRFYLVYLVQYFFMLEQQTSTKTCTVFCTAIPPSVHIFRDSCPSSWILDFSTFWLLSTEMQRIFSSNPPKRLQVPGTGDTARVSWSHGGRINEGIYIYINMDK